MFVGFALEFTPSQIANEQMGRCNMNAQVEKYNVVSFSGGRTSAYLIHRIQAMVSQGLIKNVKYVFMDTGAEHPKTYEFIRQVVKHFEID